MTRSSPIERSFTIGTKRFSLLRLSAISWGGHWRWLNAEILNIDHWSLLLLILGREDQAPYWHGLELHGWMLRQGVAAAIQADALGYSLAVNALALNFLAADES